MPTAKRPFKPEVVLAYDLGGTKVAVGVVTARGKVLEEIRTPVVFQEGKAAVIRQLGELGAELLKRYPAIRKIGIASAGPLDPDQGILLDPTNFASKKGTWGNTPLASLLRKKLKYPIYLENDAAAAMLAEHWVGRAKKYKNAMILTLGTGLGTGIIVNGELVRSGRGLHPEAGHIIIRAGDETAPCGCGNLGCAEAFLSGRNFSRRARTRFANPNLTAKDIAEVARSKRDPRALAAFSEYAEMMAVAISNYVRLYAPEIIVLTGSFAEAADLFVPATRQTLKRMLEKQRIGDLMPEIEVSSLNNEAGIIGGAYVALTRSNAASARN